MNVPEGGYYEEATAAQSTRILSSIFDVSSAVKSLPLFTQFRT